MIEVKDQRPVEEQIRDNIEAAEKSLIIASDLVSDKERFDKLMNIIDDLKRLK